jgi:hypothetical protein
MPNLSQPVSDGVIVASVAFILLCIAAGLGICFYYRKKFEREGKL